MPDQAAALRRLVGARGGPAAGAEAGPPAARSLLFTSGKGGVGTTNLALNLAVALGEQGRRVVLVDADLGLANVDLLCGICPPVDLGDVLDGRAGLADAIVEGPGPIRVVAGAHGSRMLAESLADAPGRLAGEFAELEAGCDFLIVDAGSGLNPGIAAMAAAADRVVVVTTPEPTSVADAHAAIRRLYRCRALRAVVNQAQSAGEAADVLARLSATSRQFFGAVVAPMGHVRLDPAVPRSVRRRRPFLVDAPNSAAARGVRRLAGALIAERRPATSRPGFFAGLAARLAGPGPLGPAKMGRG